MSPFFSVPQVSIASVNELKNNILDRNNKLKELQKEIDEYEAEIKSLSKEKNSLSNEIKKLDVTEKKLKANIRYTEGQIEKASLSIDKLAIDIDQKKEDIDLKKRVIAEIVRGLNEDESMSMIEMALINNNFSDFFSDMERMENFQEAIGVNLDELSRFKEELEVQKNDKEENKKELEEMRGKFKDQNSLVLINKTKKNTLLKETKNKESNYKQLLADRIAKKEALEEEIKDFENKLRVEIDPDSLPLVGPGVLNWPIDDVRITQYFGNTPFATKNPQVYNGGGHNGVDFGASIGTPLKSAEKGIVIGVGDTDKECAGVSYGRWVLIEHPNNLTTLYAHLSLIKVTKGQEVASGQVIGYSGDTGYTTGPHLHFTVYAARAVDVGMITSKVCGTKMTLPLAPREWYLNPLSYL
ncbi:MAG: peptidoglycan DD-metalloendopeptidase family protein [Parcubacteria group bacterium]|nr:peptidoglycan DD-metalloendopeptidase family protein [Parcubacteria group bacterium]MCR4342332.1 peptidoglycan DD-metalloendopeptidase family protein [Patescibacteria group bacterium]